MHKHACKKSSFLLSLENSGIDLENILKVGEADAAKYSGMNEMATYIADADGLNKIEDLQHHSNQDIYDKCVKIMETYFGVEEEEDMPDIAPNMDGNQFSFGTQGSGMHTNFDFSG